MKKIRYAPLAVACACGVLAFVPAQAAQTVIDYNFPDSLFDPISTRITNPQAPLELSSTVTTASGESRSTTIRATAQYGVLKAYIHAESSGSDQFSGGGRLGAAFADTLTIDSVGRSGLAGTITVNFLHSWSLALDSRKLSGTAGSLSALYSFSLGTFTGGASENLSIQCQNRPSCENSRQSGIVINDGFGVNSVLPYRESFTLTAPITFGTPFPIGAGLVGTGGAFEGVITFNAENSGYWGGILEVRDAGGQSVDFSTSSASGTDYLRSFAPVPEPTQLTLMLVGLCAVVSLRNHRKQS